MVANPDRDARMESACRALFESYGDQFTVKQLTKEAKVSATVATPWRRDWLAKRQLTGTGHKDNLANSASSSLPASESAEAMLPGLLKLAASSQDHVTTLLNLVNALLSHLPKAPGATPLIQAMLAPNIVPTTMDMTGPDGPDGQIDGEPPINQWSSLSQSPEYPAERPTVATKLKAPPIRNERRADGPDNSKADASQSVVEFGQGALSADTAKAKGESTPQPSSAESQPKSSDPVKSVAKSTQTQESAVLSSINHEQRTQITIQAARKVLVQEKGPLASFEIHRRIPTKARELYSIGHLKTVLLREDSVLRFEKVERKFWLTSTTVFGRELEKPIAAWEAALREATHILNDAAIPAEVTTIYAALSVELRAQLSVESFLNAMKIQGRTDQTFLQIANGNWLLREHADAASIGVPRRRPLAMLPELEKEAQKIITENAWSMTAAQIHKNLSDGLRWHYDPNKFYRYINRLPKTIFVLNDDDRWHLANDFRSGPPPKKQDVKSARAIRQAKTKLAVDAALKILVESGQTMTLSELFDLIGSPVDRNSFRRGMNQRRKSMSALERVAEGLYRVK
ncbi:hypothetical protein SAMN05443247_06014 [Bradyrhizobium erythrophlei]|nr:hypothetical protein SAMN05443247_06014 [Bradyrhizobium erythrophlei]